MGRILVTGATGFVGYAVIKQLVAEGLDIVCVTRAEKQDTLGDFPVSICPTQDMFSETVEWWQGVCADVDMIVHIAWYAEPGKYLTSDKNIDCMIGTLKMAQGAVAAGVGRIVGVGTCFEYDLSAEELSVNTPLSPETPYAAAKVATFTMLKSWLSANDVEFLWARLFYLHGEREDARRLVPYLHQMLRAGEPADLTSGEAVRDYMDVEDAAKLLLKDALSSRQGATNICSGKGTTIRALAEAIADGYGRRDLLNFGARPDSLTDPPIVIGVRTETS